MQIISRQAVADSLNYPQLIQALRYGFAQDAGTPMRQVFELDNSDSNHDAFAVLPAWNADVIGVKAFTYFPNNNQHHKASLYSKIMLFGREFGEPLALVDGTEVTLWRTSAVSALAADYLAPKEAKHLVFFGSGNLASYMINAHLSVRKYSKVSIIARNAEKGRLLLEFMSSQHPEVEFVLHYKPTESIIASADVISCATGSPSPLFNGHWLSAGTHIDCIGNHHKTYRECDTTTVANSRVFVDSRVNVLNEAGELLLPISEGKFSAEQVVAELSEMTKNNLGRNNKDEVTLFKSVGTALSDLIGAKLVYDLVQE
ncbi:ornithine cyclodeaminase family protein [Pseudoalteromonas piscicida]|uniref:Ornithine cyclodeaminase n=1 Tax=Pseudoalteromonas piscicida TaxID=43662 RepID=A0A2A5JSM7_PSEO7|nr:ornithine cyclodeaminase family protein [Pseudoalteromonas piscicida]PCK32415.1 ornithine cyclodeaminase [Pseudoalteromonas piscicida]